jgi:hypothetical protein
MCDAGPNPARERAFGLVIAVNSREGGIHAALASVFSSPTLKVVFTAHTTNQSQEATLGEYSVALSVTSVNGSRPLSGADGVDNYEISVLRSGVDLGDLVVADQGVYARLNLQAIDAHAYESALTTLSNDVPPGAGYNLGEAFLSDQWVGLSDSTIDSWVKGFAAKEKASLSEFDNLRNAFALSFAQSWDTWASIHQKSGNGTTVYSLKLPVQHFVATLWSDVKATVLKDVPSLKADIGSISSEIGRIPASLELPITMTVTGGSLTAVAVSYKGDSLSLAISHPAVGVSAPTGATMITTAAIKSLINGLICGGSSSSSGELGLGCGCGSLPSCLGISPPNSGISGMPGTSGISGMPGTRGSGSSGSGGATIPAKATTPAN